MEENLYEKRQKQTPEREAELEKYNRLIGVIKEKYPNLDNEYDLKDIKKLCVSLENAIPYLNNCTNIKNLAITSNGFVVEGFKAKLYEEVLKTINRKDEILEGHITEEDISNYKYKEVDFKAIRERFERTLESAEKKLEQVTGKMGRLEIASIRADLDIIKKENPITYGKYSMETNRQLEELYKELENMAAEMVRDYRNKSINSKTEETQKMAESPKEESQGVPESPENGKSKDGNDQEQYDKLNKERQANNSKAPAVTESDISRTYDEKRENVGSIFKRLKAYMRNEGTREEKPAGKGKESEENVK